MNKAHRDRIAFMRICSGKFERNEEYYHVQGGKPIKLAQPQQMMAEERQIINEAYAGDIIGVFDPGIYSIGDTICSKDKKVRFEGIPTFAPEHFAAFERKDTMKRKQFETGIRQIAQEGAIQIFHEPNTGLEEVIVGVVGVLQFDVLEYRLQSEYSTAVRRRALPYENIRWISRHRPRNAHAHARHQVGAGLQGQQPPALRRRVEHRLHAQAEPRPQSSRSSPKTDNQC